jgi:LysM repeat protein
MSTYTVKQGDTLSAIAKQYGTTVDALAKNNGIANANVIKAGQTLNVGGSAPASSVSMPSLTAVTSTPSQIQQYRADVQKNTSSLSLPTINTNANFISPMGNMSTTTPPNNPPIPPSSPTPPPGSNPVPPTDGTPAPTVPTPTPTPAPTPTPTTQSSYTGGSIVDYLISTGQPYDKASRIKLAEQNGIANYQGTAKQNTELLAKLRGGSTATPTPATPSGTQQAYSAGASGLSYDDYVKTNMPTVQETEKIASELGITNLEGLAFKKPSQSSQQIYDQAYSTAGLAEIKTRLEGLYSTINAEREQARLAIADIDENPFLTESSRVGRGKRVLAQLESKISNELELAKQLSDLYEKGLTEVNNVVTRNQADFGRNQEIDQAQLNYLQKKAEMQYSQLQSSKSAQNLSSYASGKQSVTKPEVVGSSDTGYYMWSPELKKFTRVVAPAPKTSTTTGTFKPTQDQQALVGRFLNSQAGRDAGASPDDMAKALADQGFFYFLLQKANESGIY